jgi:hypothetical protein
VADAAVVAMDAVADRARIATLLLITKPISKNEYISLQL